MKHILLACLFLLSISCVHRTTVKTQPVSVHEQLEESVVRLSNRILGTQYEVGVCTAFSVGQNRFLTAAHCIEDYVQDADGQTYRVVMRLDGHVATPLVVEDTLDLAVVVSDLDRPALHIRKDTLTRFETVYAMGYGHGFTQPIITTHKALLFHYSLGGGIWPGNVYSNPFVGGMSGGPVYDEAGLVVGIVQRASPYIGYGVDLEMLHGFLGE